MPTNINDATYFELRLVEVLCQARGIEFSYKSDLERYKKLVFKSHGELGQNKIEVQEKRLTKGLRAFLEKTAEIEISSGQTLTDIDWVGRNHIGSRVADVDLFFGRNHVVPVSVKSGGPGTDRNLAGRSLKDLLNYDSQLTMREMMNETLDVLRNAVPDIKLQPAWKPMRESVDSHGSKTYLRELAKEVGQKFQSKFSAELQMAWATSSDQQKESMLRYLALQNDDRDIGLIIFVAEDESSYFKLPPDISKVSAADLKLRPLSQSNSGTLELLVDDTPVWRLNINFTNGLGLSPLAIRVFRL